MFDAGIGYSGINTARSAVSQLAVTGLGAHPLVVRFMKGVFQMRPSKPRYVSTWDVSIVLRFLSTLSPVRFLSLKQLTIKTVLLLALVFAARTQLLSLLDLSRMSKSRDKVEFTFDVTELKQSRPGYVPPPMVVTRYNQKREICPVVALLEYVKRTSQLRGSETKLFISFCKPHHKVAGDSISRWVKTGLCQAGIDTQMFKAHSVRAAATSRAKAQDVPIDTILKTAGWTRAATFAKFYHKQISPVENHFQQAVLQM